MVTEIATNQVKATRFVLYIQHRGKEALNQHHCRCFYSTNIIVQEPRLVKSHLKESWNSEALGSFLFLNSPLHPLHVCLLYKCASCAPPIPIVTITTCIFTQWILRLFKDAPHKYFVHLITNRAWHRKKNMMLVL